MNKPIHPLLVRMREPATVHLLPLLQDALRTCAERHQLGEGHGSDSFSFGTDAWSFPNRLFRNAIDQEEIPFSLTKERGCVLCHGSDRIRHHRVGWSENDDIATSFPGGAKSLVAEFGEAQQLVLPFDSSYGLTDCEVGGVVLAYMANPRYGLCSAYLALVARVERGKIVEWADTLNIYMRPAGEDPDPLTNAPSVPPPEPPQLPIVRRKEKKLPDAGST
ncbi:MAG: hypothetical protein R3B70_41780 [Polyangiaceae bacterium]